MSYIEYLQVAQRVASAADHRSTQSRRSRQANVHIIDEDTDEVQDHEDDYDDDPFSVYSTKRKTNKFYRRPSLKKATWEALDQADKTAWDSISDRGKRSIIFAHKDDPKPVGESAKTTKTYANVHVIEEETSEAEDDDDDDLEPILVNAAASKPTGSKSTKPKVDLKKLMSQGTSKTKSSSTKRSNPNLKVNVAQTHVTYRVSQVASHHEHSLVDRGANGGIAGRFSPVRVAQRETSRRETGSPGTPETPNSPDPGSPGHPRG